MTMARGWTVSSNVRLDLIELELPILRSLSLQLPDCVERDNMRADLTLIENACVRLRRRIANLGGPR